jgi:hypothetical protein
MTDQATLERFLSVFASPPAVKVDEPTGAYVIGPFTVTKTVNKVTGLGGRTYEVPSYILDVDPGDGDPLDLASGSILAVGIALAESYARYLAKTVEDALVTDALAADYEAEKQALKDAHDEGYRYYQQTAPGDRTNQANPYPYGIAHYGEWLKGYNQADEETVF